MNPIQKAAQEWEADAINKNRANPQLAKKETDGDLCIPCMMPHPCICDWRRTLPKMRDFYEKNRRSLLRSEPVLKLNWGEKGDGLMDGLYKIAREPYEAEIQRLRNLLNRSNDERPLRWG